MPTSVQDCMDMASLEYETNSERWHDAVDNCVLGLFEPQIIEFD